MRRHSVPYLLSLFSTASRHAGRRKLVGRVSATSGRRCDRPREAVQLPGACPRRRAQQRTKLYSPVRRPAIDMPDPSEPELAARKFAYAAPEDARERPVALVLRRRWTTDQKRQLVWDGLNSGKPLARFARQHGIHPSVMHRSLKALTRPILTAGPVPPGTFASVRVADAPLLPTPELPTRVPVSASASHHGMIEIELAGGKRIRVGSGVDADALRRVVAVLDSPA